jgi:hypothetical protein
MTHYIPSLNKFYHLYLGLRTEEELDSFNDMETEWKRSQPRYSFYDYINMFPEGKSAAKRGLRAKIKSYRSEFADVNTFTDYVQNEMINKMDFKSQPPFKQALTDYCSDWVKRIEKKIKVATFQLSFLEESKYMKEDITPADILRAKEVPIENFYTDKLMICGQRAKGKCPFHIENTSSFTVYLDQNSFYCYGCSFGGSVIDYVMKKEGIEFLSAVKFLLR